jgi:hypothetical protein
VCLVLVSVDGAFEENSGSEPFSAEILLSLLCGCLIFERLMGSLVAVAAEPDAGRCAQFVDVVSVAHPDQLDLERLDESLGDGVPGGPAHRNEGDCGDFVTAMSNSKRSSLILNVEENRRCGLAAASPHRSLDGAGRFTQYIE